MFTLKIGEDSHFGEYFSHGLKPPTSLKLMDFWLDFIQPTGLAVVVVVVVVGGCCGWHVGESVSLYHAKPTSLRGWHGICIRFRWVFWNPSLWKFTANLWFYRHFRGAQKITSDTINLHTDFFLSFEITFLVLLRWVSQDWFLFDATVLQEIAVSEDFHGMSGHGLRVEHLRASNPPKIASWEDLVFKCWPALKEPQVVKKIFPRQHQLSH